MNKHHKVLELDKILTMLSQKTTFKDACEQALNIEPSTNINEVKHILSQTNDAHMLIGRFGSPSFGSAKNVTNSLARANAGATLGMLELLRIAEVLRVIRSVTSWRSKSAGIKTSLDIIFESLVSNKFLEERITSCILSEDEIADNASSTLLNIRRKILSATAKAKSVLEKMIRSQTHQKHLQDAIITIRSDRYVVPVKAEFRSNISGLVHDTSASGATVFIEPMGVVEANNEIKVLRIKENEEIERILYELSMMCGEFADQIIGSYENLITLNVIFAKANLAYDMKAVIPKINDNGFINIKRGRHPLIDKNVVVPTDINLGLDFDTLVITGPNTGGKTVCLKTLGLFTLMAMCGLMIPAYDDSELSLFDNILADIGDEQSIEQSLSTFSSHMTNISKILKIANNKSLVLIDELGAGTDPIEGAALAISILENLRKNGAKIASTTHYAEIKSYALRTARVENACCEFDVTTLSPTYKLLIGVAGKSNAFEISKRLGISDDIINNARDLVSSEDKNFENVMEQLEVKRQELEKRLQNAQNEISKAKQDRITAKKELEDAKKKAEKELKKAQAEASAITSKTKAQAFAIIDELDEIKKKKEKLSNDNKAKLTAGIKSMENFSDPVVTKKNENYKLPRELKVGDSVLIVDIEETGMILSTKDKQGNVTVQIGLIKTKTKESNLRLVENNKQQNKPKPKSRNVKSIGVTKAVTEVSLRGMTAFDAIIELDNAIDSAILSNIGQITIIHGKGTGVLRREVHMHLKAHKAIKSYRLGVFGEGGDGVTIATLKN